MDSVEAKERKQYIVVKTGNELYGIDIQYIDNIVRMQRITRVPKAQKYFTGVINLRGEVIPVMSLRLKFNLEPENFNNKTRILILKIEPQASIGIIVDEVKEVVTFASDDIDKITHEASDEMSSYLIGVGQNGDALVSILNVNAVIIEKDKEI